MDKKAHSAQYGPEIAQLKWDDYSTIQIAGWERSEESGFPKESSGSLPYRVCEISVWSNGGKHTWDNRDFKILLKETPEGRWEVFAFEEPRVMNEIEDA